jgi:Antitoxin MazE-like
MKHGRKHPKALDSKRSTSQMPAKAPVRKAKPKPSAAKRTGGKSPRPKSSEPKSSEPKSSRDKVRAYRERMRAKGFRLVQLWVPDRRAAAGIPADAQAPSPQGRAITFDDIAELAGSVDGLPADLSQNTKKYLRATGHDGKHSC